MLSIKNKDDFDNEIFQNALVYKKWHLYLKLVLVKKSQHQNR